MKIEICKDKINGKIYFKKIPNEDDPISEESLLKYRLTLPDSYRMVKYSNTIASASKITISDESTQWPDYKYHIFGRTVKILNTVKNVRMGNEVNAISSNMLSHIDSLDRDSEEFAKAIEAISSYGVFIKVCIDNKNRLTDVEYTFNAEFDDYISNIFVISLLQNSNRVPNNRDQIIFQNIRAQKITISKLNKHTSAGDCIRGYLFEGIKLTQEDADEIFGEQAAFPMFYLVEDENDNHERLAFIIYPDLPVRGKFIGTVFFHSRFDNNDLYGCQCVHNRLQIVKNWYAIM